MSFTQQLLGICFEKFTHFSLFFCFNHSLWKEKKKKYEMKRKGTLLKIGI